MLHMMRVWALPGARVFTHHKEEVVPLRQHQGSLGAANARVPRQPRSTAKARGAASVSRGIRHRPRRRNSQDHRCEGRPGPCG